MSCVRTETYEALVAMWCGTLSSESVLAERHNAEASCSARVPVPGGCAALSQLC